MSSLPSMRRHALALMVVCVGAVAAPRAGRADDLSTLDSLPGRLDAAASAALSATSIPFDPTHVSVGALADTLPDAASVQRWLRENTTFDPYDGALRGARGVLFSGGGNALDRALLACGLFAERGVACRIATADLTDDQARALLESAVTSSSWSGADAQADAPGYAPGADARRRGQVTRHYWSQINQGGRWTDVDPTFPGLRVGEAVGEATSTFAPDDTPDAVERQVTIGVYFSASTSRGGEVLSVSAPLLDVAYRNVSLTLDRSSGAVTPALDLGAGPQRGAGIPLVGLDRVWLQIVVRTGAVEERILRDLYVSGSSVNLFDRDEAVLSLVLLPGFVGDGYLSAVAATLAGNVRADVEALRGALPAPAGLDVTARLPSDLAARARARVSDALGLVSLSFANTADREAVRLGRALGVRPYFSRPRVLIAGAFRDGATTEVQLDVRADEIEAIPDAGVPAVAATAFVAVRGPVEAAIASDVLSALVGRDSLGVDDAIERATASGATLVTVYSGTVRRLSSLGYSAEAVGRLEALVNTDGRVALAPNRDDEGAGLAWWTLEPNSGAISGGNEHGAFDASTFLPDGFAESQPSDGRVAAIAATSDLVAAVFGSVRAVAEGRPQADRDATLCAALCTVASMRRSLCSDERDRTVPRASACIRGATARDAGALVALGTSCSAQLLPAYCGAAIAESASAGRVETVAGPSPPLPTPFGYERAPDLAACECEASR